MKNKCILKELREHVGHDDHRSQEGIYYKLKNVLQQAKQIKRATSFSTDDETEAKRKVSQWEKGESVSPDVLLAYELLFFNRRLDRLGIVERIEDLGPAADHKTIEENGIQARSNLREPEPEATTPIARAIQQMIRSDRRFTIVEMEHKQRHLEAFLRALPGVRNTHELKYLFRKEKTDLYNGIERGLDEDSFNKFSGWVFYYYRPSNERGIRPTHSPWFNIITLKNYLVIIDPPAANINKSPESEFELTACLLVSSDSLVVTKAALMNQNPAYTREDNVCATPIVVYVLTRDNFRYRIILASTPLPGRGGDATAYLSSLLIHTYRPSIICHLGTCAATRNCGAAVGDVFIGIEAFRHDVTNRDDHWRDSTLSARVGEYVFTRNESRIRIGIYATGNRDIVSDQDVIELAEYSGRQKAHPRTLVLDTEAYALAYAANLREVEWLICKGVDCIINGDAAKSATQARIAAKNAAEVAIDLLGECIHPWYSETRTADAEDFLNQSKHHYRQGEMPSFVEFAEKAYALGLRSPYCRRHYGRALRVKGGAEWRNWIEQARTERLYDDWSTICSRSEYLFRTGSGDAMVELANEIATRQSNPTSEMAPFEIESRQAAARIFIIHGKAGEKDWMLDMANNQLVLCQELLAHIKPADRDFFWSLPVVQLLYYKVRGIDPPNGLKDETRMRLAGRSAATPLNGTLRTYIALFHAICGDATEFKIELAKGSHPIPLDHATMFHWLLDAALPKSDPDGLWAEAARWLTRSRLVGYN